MNWLKILVLVFMSHVVLAIPPDANINDVVLNELLFNPHDLSPTTNLGQDCNGDGTPGQDGNSASDAGDEFVEFYNNGITDVDLEGYCLAHDLVVALGAIPDDESRWLIPSGIIVPAGGFVHICGDDNGPGIGFSNLDAQGDEIHQFANSGSGAGRSFALYQPTTAGDCGSGVATVIISTALAADDESAGESRLRCFIDGTSPLGYYDNANGDFYTPSPGEANCTVATPVYLNHIAFNNQNIQWQTSLEFNHVGFNLYAINKGKKTKLNKSLITNTNEGDYTFTVPDKVQVKEIMLTAINADGSEKTLEVIAENFEFGKRAEYHANKWQQLVSNKSIASEIVARKQINIVVNKTGIQKVTFHDLQNNGFNLSAVSARNLQLSTGDEVVPFHISNDNSLIFIGKKSDSIYSDNRIYRLQYVRNSQRIQVVKGDESGRSDDSISYEVPTYFMAKMKVEENNNYEFSNSTDDPWTMQRMLAYSNQPNEESWQFQLPYLDQSASSEDESIVVSAEIIGVTDFPGVDSDHHMAITINANNPIDYVFDGTQAISITNSLQNNTTSSTIDVSLRQAGDTGFDFDLVNVDKFSITYPRQFIASSDNIDFESDYRQFSVDGFSGPTIILLAQNAGVTQLINPKVTFLSGQGYRVEFKNELPDSHIFIAEENAINRPEVVSYQPVEYKPADILLVTKGYFEAQLAHYVAAKTAEGLTVQVVDIDDLIAQFGSTGNNPLTIKKFIQRANSKHQLKYVMIVGSDQYDYKNYLGTNAVSIVPTFYRNTGNGINHAPTDTPYVDFDNDNIADIPIGRLSVNNQNELENILQKILTYQTGSLLSDLFVTDNVDQENFNQMAFHLAESSAYSSKVINSYQLGIEQANSDLLSELNNGVGMVNWIGHSSSTRWSRDNIFDIEDVNSLVNPPAVFYQLGCWNSYFVDPINQNLANALLQKQNHGAVATIGSSTFTKTDGEKLLAQYVQEYIGNNKHVTLGDALVYALRKYGKRHPDRLDILLGYQLLGDPSMLIK